MGTDDSERTGRLRGTTADASDGRSDDGADGGGSTGSRRRAAPMSRRSFVLASGSALGASVVGFGRGAADDATAITVTASEPYRPVVSETAGDGRPGNGPDVAVRSPGDDPLAAVSDGNVDVHVSGRPQIVSADGSVRSIAREEIVTGRGALVHDGVGWCECISTSGLSERTPDDEPLETWSETDWQSFEAVEPAGGSTAAVRSVVRGTRSFQYARGRGGVGYYSVDRESLRVDPGSESASPDRVTPLVRLGYAHVDRSTASDGPPSVRRLAGEQSRETVDESSYFPGPGLRATD